MKTKLSLLEGPPAICPPGRPAVFLGKIFWFHPSIWKFLFSAGRALTHPPWPPPGPWRRPCCPRWWLSRRISWDNSVFSPSLILPSPHGPPWHNVTSLDWWPSHFTLWPTFCTPYGGREPRHPPWRRICPHHWRPRICTGTGCGDLQMKGSSCKKVSLWAFVFPSPVSENNCNVTEWLTQGREVRLDTLEVVISAAQLRQI